MLIVAGAEEPNPRWAAESAIQASSLTPHARLLLYTLLTKVTRGTLIVPSEYAPSLTKLAKQTGMSKSTVAKHLGDLEDDKWLERDRPTTRDALKERARTGYVIHVPVRETDRSGSRTSPGDGQVPEEDLFNARPGDGPVREPDRTSPGAGHNPKSSPKSSSSSKRGVGGNSSRRKPETAIPDIFPVTDEMRAWVKNHPKVKFTVDIEIETERFINNAKQNERRCRDWLAAWRNWMLKAQEIVDDRSRRRKSTGTEGWSFDNVTEHTGGWDA